MTTKTVNVSELEGVALDWAVAKVEGMEVVIHDPSTTRFDIRGGIHCSRWGCTFGPKSSQHETKEYSPSTDWSQGGPLIEKQGIWLSDDAIDEPKGPWVASVYGAHMQYAKTPLIAACRAIVAAHFGDTVEVPEVLL